MDRITSIIFDLDGTLYNSAELADELQARATEGLALQLGRDNSETGLLLAAARAKLSASTGRETTLSAACEEIGGDIKALHGYLSQIIIPEKYLSRDERVIRMLERLGKEYGLYIYTNNNRVLAERIMRAIGIEELFAEIFSMEDFPRAKPDRLALAKIFAGIGAEPVECLFVGDRYDVDLRLPEEHGCRVLLADSVEKLLSLEKLCSKGETKDARTG